jgi:hypothetical protein
MDLIAISALIIALTNSLGAILSHLHLKKVNILGCQSECHKSGKNTEPPTPTTEI